MNSVPHSHSADPQSAFQRRVQQAQVDILRMVLPTGVKVSFGEGRRAADVAMVLLTGERAKVLSLPTRLEDELELHVHVVRSTFAGSNFELLVVFTEPLEGQAFRSPERRAALRQQLEYLEMQASGDDDLLDTGDEELRG
ncbi:MAG: hypothetical protein WDA03_14950 [Trueperaceae bacterium]